jgi:hypothetical protein
VASLLFPGFLLSLGFSTAPSATALAVKNFLVLRSRAYHAESMGKCVKTGLAITLLVVLALIAWVVGWTDGNRNHSYAAFLRTAQLRDGFAKYEFSPVYQTFSRLTGSNPARRYRLKAQAEEQALWSSGNLVSLTFWAPASRSLAEVRSPTHFIKVIAHGDDMVTVLCLPSDAASLQRLFCCITNRVPIAPLTRLAGFESDDIPCNLPDGSVVGVEALQRWLNDSIAAGWRVGIASRFSGTERCLLATRQRP